MSERRSLSKEESGRLATFVTAAKAAASDWVNAELELKSEYAAELDRWGTDRVSAWLPLNPAPESDRKSGPSHLVVAMDPLAARQFADRAFIDVGIVPERDLLGDCVAEFANLTAGRAKALTSGTPDHFLLGVPSLEPPPTRNYLVAILTGEIGEITVAVSMT